MDESYRFYYNSTVKTSDVNNGGKEDLIVETFINTHSDVIYDFYLNYANKVVKAKMHHEEQGNKVMAGHKIKTYKNYLMAVNWHYSDMASTGDDYIYKIDKNGNFNILYKRAASRLKVYGSSSFNGVGGIRTHEPR